MNVNLSPAVMAAIRRTKILTIGRVNNFANNKSIPGWLLKLNLVEKKWKRNKYIFSN